MIGIFIDDRAGGLEQRDRAEDGCWISVVAPGPDELAMLEGLGIPGSLLDHARDPDEHPRVEHDGGALLVVLRHPAESAASNTGAAPFATAPLSIIVTPRHVVTIAPEACPFVAELQQHAARTAAISTRQPMRFLLQLFARVAEEFLECMRRIDREVERLEDELQRSLRNEEVLGLLRCQKSLTYFRTSIGANELVLERLQALELPGHPVDRELVQDVRVEVRQAMAMVDISADILAQMMDAFASIVSNNLNAVMKVLTSVTILLAVPTLIASLYGMNVGLPGARSAAAFGGILLVCVLVAGGLFVLFRRRNWL
jgi:magnesium transporter